MAHAEDDGSPTGPDVVLNTPESDACAAAARAELARSLAAGMSLARARIEAAKAAAREHRVQAELDPDPPDFYVPPAQRLRFDAAGRLVPPKTGRVRRRG